MEWLKTSLDLKLQRLFQVKPERFQSIRLKDDYMHINKGQLDAILLARERKIKRKVTDKTKQRLIIIFVRSVKKICWAVRMRGIVLRKENIEEYTMIEKRFKAQSMIESTSSEDVKVVKEKKKTHHHTSRKKRSMTVLKQRTYSIPKGKKLHSSKTFFKEDLNKLEPLQKTQSQRKGSKRNLIAPDQKTKRPQKKVGFLNSTRWQMKKKRVLKNLKMVKSLTKQPEKNNTGNPLQMLKVQLEQVKINSINTYILSTKQVMPIREPVFTENIEEYLLQFPSGFFKRFKYLLYFPANFILFFLFSNFHRRREGTLKNYYFSMGLCIILLLILILLIIEETICIAFSQSVVSLESIVFMIVLGMSYHFSLYNQTVLEQDQKKQNFGFYLHFLKISNTKLGLGYSFIGCLAYFTGQEIGLKDETLQSLIIAYGLLFIGVGLTFICQSTESKILTNQIAIFLKIVFTIFSGYMVILQISK